MTSFTSTHYPKTKNAFTVMQEIAMHYYAIFNFALMLLVLYKISAGQSILWFTLLSELGIVILANAFSYVSLRKRYAEIFFVGEHFSLISVYDILYEQKNHAFPLRFASPQRTQDEITIHFNDQIITLKRADWDEFDLIWDWLNATNYM